ncbi:MAG: glycosyltransferase [Candidatus Dadabacteria bacterium]|nr:MAG: glycosyltransferase [Candidatus Dadabacteria bacterium]
MTSVNRDEFLKYISLNDPLVSVVVPAFNKQDYILETLQSILAQDYKNIELIIVNDSSTDNTVEVVKSFSSNNPSCNIRVLDKPNGGTSDAKNFGIRHANSRVVLTVDADDLLRPNYISTGIKMMRERGANLFCANVEIFGARTGEWIPHEYDTFMIRYDNCIAMAQMYDKALWEAAGGFKTSFAFVEDWELWVNFSRFGLVVAKAPEKLIRYRVTPDGLHNTFIENNRRECLALVVTANQDLYPVEDVIASHDLIAAIPDHITERFKKQESQHQNEWLLKFWLGLAAEKRGEAGEASRLYGISAQLAPAGEWQPAYRQARLLDAHGDFNTAQQIYHQIRILRPDMHKYVQSHINDILARARGQMPQK